MAKQVQLYFDNGGGEAWVTRIADGTLPANITLNNEAGVEALVLTAKEAGIDGNLLRAEVLDRIKGSREAKLERLSFMPEKKRERSIWIVDYTIGFLKKKYPVAAGESAALLLEEIRAELKGRPYLLDDFSYADITLSQPLQFVSPVSSQYVKLVGKYQKQTFENVELAREFKDLIDWRDELYEKHR